MFNLLINNNLLNTDQPIVQVTSRKIIRKTQGRSEIFCEQALSGHALHWQTLYTYLKSIVPDEKIKPGHRVVAIEGTTLTFTNQNHIQQQTLDLILGADGHHSFTAKNICDIQSEYAGYIAWRGTTPLTNFLQEIFGPTQDSKIAYFVYPLGHCIMYLIHDPIEKKPLVNWVFYEKRALSTLSDILPTHEKDRYFQTIPRG